MEAAIRPHRSGTVLGLGITSLAVVLASIAVASRGFDLTFFCLLACVIAALLGGLAIVLGWRQIAGMRAELIDPRGRRKTRTGQAFGAAAVILALLLTTGLIVYFPRDHSELYADGSTTTTEMYYRDVLKAEYSQGGLGRTESSSKRARTRDGVAVAGSSNRATSTTTSARDPGPSGTRMGRSTGRDLVSTTRV